jgi:hypothetical protein
VPWGAYHVTFGDIPTIQYGILLPILVGALLIRGSETARRIIAAVPQQRLVGVQLYRALGVIFLILYVTGKLPGQLAWPAGVGDIAIGLSAPFVGLAYARSLVLHLASLAKLRREASEGHGRIASARA